jgi:hypothetical protein
MLLFATCVCLLLLSQVVIILAISQFSRARATHVTFHNVCCNSNSINVLLPHVAHLPNKLIEITLYDAACSIRLHRVLPLARRPRQQRRQAECVSGKRSCQVRGGWSLRFDVNTCAGACRRPPAAARTCATLGERCWAEVWSRPLAERRG